MSRTFNYYWSNLCDYLVCVICSFFYYNNAGRNNAAANITPVLANLIASAIAVHVKTLKFLLASTLDCKPHIFLDSLERELIDILRKAEIIIVDNLKTNTFADIIPLANEIKLDVRGLESSNTLSRRAKMTASNSKRTGSVSR